jgi:hypothetical protein
VEEQKSACWSLEFWFIEWSRVPVGVFVHSKVF